MVPDLTSSQERRANLVVMLTADRQIDRRILLEADSLGTAGWEVIILGMPLDPGQADVDPRVRRVGEAAVAAAQDNFIMGAYRFLRRCLPMNGFLMRGMKSFAWRYLFDQENFFVRLFAGSAFRYSPKIFVAHDLPMLPVARQAAERCGAKLVYDSHELYSEQEFSRQEKQRWAEIEAKHVGACDAVITVNPSIATELEHRHGLQRVHVVYNAERLQRGLTRQWRFHERFGLASGVKVLLFQGGLSAGRNIEALVEAFGAIQNSMTHLVIMGDGQLRARLKAIADHARCADKVHFHPAVSQHDLLDFTASADAGVIPYQATCLNNRYCTPNKLFEFIAAGVPILASNLPEIERIVSTYSIGMVGDLSTSRSIASIVDEFFCDGARMQKWRTNAEEARSAICWEREGSKIVEIFEALK